MIVLMSMNCRYLMVVVVVQVHGPGLKGDNKNLVEQSSELRKLQDELKQSHKKSQGGFTSRHNTLLVSTW